MPNFEADDRWFEVAAGVLDEDPGLRPDRHIFIDYKSAWHDITDELPQSTKQDVIRMRIAEMKKASTSELPLAAGRDEGKD